MSDFTHYYKKMKLAPSAALARVIGRNTKDYTLHTEGEELQGIILKTFLKKRAPQDLPAVGDFVTIEKLQGEQKAVITEVLPRYATICRKNEGKVQVIAVNVDTLFIVESLDRTMDFGRIERYLSLASMSNVAPVIVLNKTDTTEHSKRSIAEIKKRIPNSVVIATSAKNQTGIDAFNKYITAGHTIAFVGQSGAGKSSLINRLIGQEKLKTGNVRESDHLGKHTTTKREIVYTKNNVAIIDTPGMRDLGLLEKSTDENSPFAALEALALHCKFANCDHKKSAGCAIIPAVTSGTIPKNQYLNFLHLAEKKTKKPTRVNRKRLTN